MKIVIDPGAGFCPGVAHTIHLAEELLQKKTYLYSLGSLIHNSSEISRLQQLGMKSLEHDSLQQLEASATVLTRAHGEPPAVFQDLEKKNVSIVDGTCQIVRKSQQKVRSYSQREYQVIFVGKKDHPEAIAIAGYCQHPMIIVEKSEDLEKIDPLQKTVVFAQTTISPSFFDSILELMKNKGLTFTTENTICKYIKKRDEAIHQLASKSEVVIVVGGRNSSNTAVLFQQCRAINARTYWIQDPADLQQGWFDNIKQVGITGGTSTPKWMLEKVEQGIENLGSHSG
jgi:4-hydroxy-3-methylbut-2-enyl diphosphate reductase